MPGIPHRYYIATIMLLAASAAFLPAAKSDDLSDGLAESQTSDAQQPTGGLQQTSMLQPQPAPPQTPPAQPGSPLPVLPETEVQAQPQGGQQGGATSPQPASGAGSIDNPYPLPSILQGTIFSAGPTNGYNADSSTVGSITNTPNLTYPGTINVVTPQMIQDQQIINFTDALRDIGGAVSAEGANGNLLQDSFFMRGLEVTTQNFRKDGFLDPTFVARDMANVQRIDVLKGPSSVLYGAAQPAGTVNLVTKKAFADTYSWGGITGGSYGLQRYAFDYNSPLNQDKTLLFRVNGAYMKSDSFIQDVHNERIFIAPTMTWVAGEYTSVTWSGEYEYNDFTLNPGTIAVNGNPFAIARSTFLGDPNANIARYQAYRSTLQLTHQFNDVLTGNIGASSLFYNTPSTSITPDYTTAINPTTGFISSPIIGRDLSQASIFQEQNQDFIGNLAADVDTWGINHKALAGFEFDWFITNHDQFVNSSGGSFGQINAATGQVLSTSPLSPPGSYSVFDNPAFRQNRQGFYLQDLMSAGKWQLMLANRFDWMTQTYDRSLTSYAGLPPNTSFPYGPPYDTGEIRTQQNFYRWSPKVGITYSAIPDVLTFYGTYARSFTPSVGVINFTPTPLLPQLGEIYEAGIKCQFLPNLTGTVAGYHITQTNVNTQVFNPLFGQPGQPLYITSQAGLQRAQGVEMNLNGNLTERWSWIANWNCVNSRAYGINTTTSTGQPITLNGSPVLNVPMYNANIWTRYNMIQEKDRVAGIALGMVYVGERLGDYSSPLELPAYTRWDSGFFYRQGRVTGQIYWENMFNIDYVTNSISQYNIYRGAPSNMRAQISVVW